MNNEDHLKQFMDAHKVRMNDADKARIRAHLDEYMRTHRPVKSPWSFGFAFSHASFFAKSVAFVLICLLVGGGTLSYASTDALPGDALYGVKVKVKEEIEAAVAFTPEAKLANSTKRIERRLTEVQTLLAADDVNPEKHHIAEVYMAEHVESLTKDIKKLKEEGDVETILEATSTLEPILLSHKKLIEGQRNDTKNERSAKKAKSEQKKIDDASPSNTEIEPANDSARNAASETPSEGGADLATMATMNDSESFTVNLSSEIVVVPEDENPDAEQIQEEASFDLVTSSLLATVESTLETVQTTEKEALEAVSEQIEKEEKVPDVVIEITEDRVLEAEERIQELKDDEIMTPATDTNVSTEGSVETPGGASEASLLMQGSTDASVTATPEAEVLSIARAQALLDASKTAYQAGNFAEALTLSQQAVKMLKEIENEQELSKAFPSDAAIKIEASKTPEASTPDPTQSIDLQAQAKESIRFLESAFTTNVTAQKAIEIKTTLPQ